MEHQNKREKYVMVAPVHSPGAQVRTHGEEGNEWEEVHVQGQPHGVWCGSVRAEMAGELVL